jgi:cytochrome c oxidase cbb3-type subunit 3
VASYVYDLSHPGAGAADLVAAGRQVFADNCVACHGEDARGAPGTGAPDLTDAFWLYGGDQASIFTSIYNGRQGHMPTWEARLSDTDRKILTLYVLDLGRSGR